ncbi:MAG TPA: DNA primase noncatalytic subunit PriX [Nitrososphaerales archaeon]|nr:DNA primase noncatalytic subunit PriX [Nitrososphaerales archaeon]
MSYGGPSLTDLELRYPFAPRSRKFFESIPVEEGLASREVLGQAQGRLLSALGRLKYEPHISEVIEFSSFFAAALVASQDGFLASKFSEKEAERAKGFFVGEGGREKATVMSECFGATLGLSEGESRPQYTMPFESYLSIAARYELTKSPKWKLTRQPLTRGTVILSGNLLNDLFADCARGAISEGVKNLRRGVFPKQLQDVKVAVMRYVPVQKQRTGKGYLYVEDLLSHPVSDGRHRLVWLVLAPYLVNVKKVENDEAIDRIRAFVSVAGETRDMKRFVEYNVRRARRNGLLPPTLSTLKNEHPDLYGLLPKEVLEAEAKPKAMRQSQPQGRTVT